MSNGQERPDYAHGFVSGPGSDRIKPWWNVTRLWQLALPLPIEDVPLSELSWVLDQCPHQPQTKRELAEFVRRIGSADLNYPVILGADDWLMDGSHRIMKAYAQHLPTVRAVRFGTPPTPDYRATPREMGYILSDLRRGHSSLVAAYGEAAAASQGEPEYQEGLRYAFVSGIQNDIRERLTKRWGTLPNALVSRIQSLDDLRALDVLMQSAKTTEKWDYLAFPEQDEDDK